MRAGLADQSVGDRDNIVRLDHLRVRVAPASLPQGLPDNYRNIMLVVANYDVVQKQEIASSNGANTRFVYVGQDVKTGHWRILEIGTGP